MRNILIKLSLELHIFFKQRNPVLKKNSLVFPVTFESVPTISCFSWIKPKFRGSERHLYFVIKTDMLSRQGRWWAHVKLIYLIFCTQMNFIFYRQSSQSENVHTAWQNHSGCCQYSVNRLQTVIFDCCLCCLWLSLRLVHKSKPNWPSSHRPHCIWILC